MKCSKCHKKNIREANYCKYCGKAFTDTEKERAAHSGGMRFVNVFQKLKKLDEIRTLSIIKDNVIVKIVVLVIVLGIGIYNIITMGGDLKVLDNKIYDVKYNDKTSEYYVLLDKDNRDNIIEVSLDLFIPNHIKKLNFAYYDEAGELINENQYDKDDKLMVSANRLKDNYYIVSDADDKNENIKVYVYYEDEE